MSEYEINLKHHWTGAEKIVISGNLAVLVGGPLNGRAFGPTEIIPAVELPWMAESAATTVAAANIAAGGHGDGTALAAFLV